MATAEVDAPLEAAGTSGLPDYLLNPNAVLNDSANWRYGQALDYSKTRKVYNESKTKSHETATLPSLVENLVKNWEIEASFKSDISDWRTIDRPNYTFSINGGPPQSAENMLQVGTYNAIIPPNEFYSPENSDFASSHKTFKRMMPTFAWEVLEVYSGPPVVAFKWRHWGVMKNDYVGFNDKGEKVTAPAHGATIDIQGITIAHVNEKVQLQTAEIWFDPLEMFRQIAPYGIVNKTIVNPIPSQDLSTHLHGNSHDHYTEHSESAIVPEVGLEDVVTASGSSTTQKSAAEGHLVAPGDEFVVSGKSEEAKVTHEELGRITATECPFLMNQE